ncbi:MAG: NADAR family protein [bacterium]|nr:NADAR family protein [bacterium]
MCGKSDHDTLDDDDEPRILFYRAEDAYGCFSNFSAHPITLDGKVWPTTEHYFQAQKYAGTPKEDLIRSATTPGRAARIGRGRDGNLRADWAAVKDAVMERCVLAKFEQHDDIREILLATCDARLVEHTRNDDYWADGGDGEGGNKLGLVLEPVRRTLRRQAVLAALPAVVDRAAVGLALLEHGTCVACESDHPELNLAEHARSVASRSLGPQDAPAGQISVERLNGPLGAVVRFGCSRSMLHVFLSVEARPYPDVLLGLVARDRFVRDCADPCVVAVLDIRTLRRAGDAAT